MGGGCECAAEEGVGEGAEEGGGGGEGAEEGGGGAEGGEEGHFFAIFCCWVGLVWFGRGSVMVGCDWCLFWMLKMLKQ